MLRFALILFPALLAVSCQKSAKSSVKITDVQHTSIKDQSIGNCWLYASAAWAESLHLRAAKKEINISESYWTYWHWYEQLLEHKHRGSVDTAGSYKEMTSLVLKYDYMLEKDFIKEEARLPESKRQELALEKINGFMADGAPLHGPATRTESNIKKYLDEAFGVQMADLAAKVKPTSELKVGKSGRSNIYLKDLLTQKELMWVDHDFPYISESTVNLEYVRGRQQEVLTRLYKAINDGHPVILNVIVDKKGLDKATSSFKGTLLDAPGAAGDTGGHMVIGEDYTMDNVPGFGSLEEGDLAPEVKAAAVNGTLRYIKVKNSWGLPEENPTADGYFKFYRDYLVETHKFKSAITGKMGQRSGLQSVVLPPGY